MNTFYTGVGSRSTPLQMHSVMRRIAMTLAERGLVLRSGGASGADTAFENGCDIAGGRKEIYLPWPRFQNHPSHLCEVGRAAMKTASRVHPAWSRCSSGARKLHARNAYQVLGRDLSTPSKFVVCWTPGGALRGGTRTAIVIAEEHGVPVVNLGAPRAVWQPRLEEMGICVERLAETAAT